MSIRFVRIEYTEFSRSSTVNLNLKSRRFVRHLVFSDEKSMMVRENDSERWKLSDEFVLLVGRKVGDVQN